MAQYSLLRDYRFSDDVDDIRNASLYDTKDDKIGKIDDVIFDPVSGNIQYAVVDAGGWLTTKKFLVPAGRIRPRAKDEKDFSTDLTKDQIKSFPEYDEKHVGDNDWDNYEKRYRESLETSGTLHKENSTHMITPQPDEMPARGASLPGEDALTPQRIAGKFPDAEPGSSKIHMRPAVSAPSEDGSIPGISEEPAIPTRLEEEALDRRQPTSTGTTGTQRGRWSAFEESLRRNRAEITTKYGNRDGNNDRVA